MPRARRTDTQYQPIPETTQELRFPLGGVDLTAGFGRQPNAPTDVGMARTTALGVNVRAFEPTTRRGRGGARAGLSNYNLSEVNQPGEHVQNLEAVPATWFFPQAGGESTTGGLGPEPGAGDELPVVFVTSAAGVSVSTTAASVWTVGVPDFFAERRTRSVAGLLTGDGVEEITAPAAGTVVGGEGVIVRSGQEYVARLPIAGLAHDVVALAASDGLLIVLFGTTSDGTLTAVGWDSDGIAGWTNASVGATSDPQTATAGDPASCCVGQGVVYANLKHTGVVQFDAATGAAGTPFVLCPAAAMTTAAGTRYRNAGQCAYAYVEGDGDPVLAVLVATQTLPREYGVLFIDPATGAATAPLLGVETVDAQYPWMDWSGETYLISDGNHFYLNQYHYRRGDDGQRYSRVVQISRAGAVTWATDDLAVAAKAIGYSSFADLVYLSSAYQFDAGTGVTNGGGVTPAFDAFFDAGHFPASLFFANDDDPTFANNYNQVTVLVGVAGGTVKASVNGVWTATTNGDDALDTGIKVIRSTVLNGKIYYLDTVNWKYYDARTNAVLDWTASAGSLPVDANSNLPRLICTWRGRVCLSGLPLDPQNVFMSRVGDATDWDYAPGSPGPLDAVAFNTGPMGRVGDTVTGLCPYSDDTLIVFGDHTISILRGDPLYGGQLDLVTSALGGAWGICWCMDPFGVVYFMSNMGTIYTLVPGQKPQQVSDKINQHLDRVNLSQCVVRLGWDDPAGGVHVFVTPFGRQQPATHYFYEPRAKAWWLDQFAYAGQNPMCCLQFWGNTARQRLLLIGSWDGTVRAWDPDATTDNGTDIDSDVLIGPLLSATFDELMLKEVQAVLGLVTSSLRWDVYAGETAEGALARGSVAGGVFESGRSFTDPVRVSGYAIYVRLRTNRPWAAEALRVKLMTLGPSRARNQLL